jgi:4-hydroxy-tetrahydrodipicolinate synthase
MFVTGVVVPTLTPFDGADRIDIGGIEALADFLISAGVHALFPGGTTGEGPLLTMSERFALAEATIRSAAGRVPVIIHTGAVTTTETVELTRHAQTAGATAAAVISPYFYRHSDEALFSHFQTVAAAAPDFPLYLYDNPAVTGNRLSLDVICRLIEACPNIIGLKDSSGDLKTLFTLSTRYPGSFNCLTGSDGTVLPALASGLDGCVSGNANVVPELVIALYNAARSGHLDEARHLQAQLDAVRQILRDGGDLALFKGILSRRGIQTGGVRPPLGQVSWERVDHCWLALLDMGLAFLSG